MKKQEFTLGAVIDEPGSTAKNKTGGWRSFRPVWDKDRCSQCMLCWIHCPDNAIPEKDGKRQETDFDYCKGCGICEKVCPVKCIKMAKEEK
jgi:pyruvate ferredoxin oxidoreductase delta subunit